VSHHGHTAATTGSPMLNATSRDMRECPAASVAVVSTNASSTACPAQSIAASASKSVSRAAQAHSTHSVEIPHIAREKTERRGLDRGEPLLCTTQGEGKPAAMSRGPEPASGENRPDRSADASVNGTLQWKKLLVKKSDEKDTQIHQQADAREDFAVSSKVPIRCPPAPKQRWTYASLSSTGDEQPLDGPDPSQETISGHDTENSVDAEDGNRNVDKHVNDIDQNSLRSPSLRAKQDIDTLRLGGTLPSNKLLPKLSLANEEIPGNHARVQKRGKTRESSQLLGEDTRRSVQNGLPGTIASPTGVATVSVTSAELPCEGQERPLSTEETALSGSSLAVLDNRRVPEHDARERAPVSAKDKIRVETSVDSSDADTAMKWMETFEHGPATKLSASARHSTSWDSAMPAKSVCESASRKPDNIVSIVTPIERPRRNASRGAAVASAATGKDNMANTNDPPKRMSRRKNTQRRVEADLLGTADKASPSFGSNLKEGNAGAFVPNEGLGNEGMMSVRAPTAFDEVRYELRPVLGAPLLERPALRSSGQVTVVQLSKFIRGQLGARESADVIISCAGEELSDTMTLNLLVSEVWPKDDGHLILDYRFETSNRVL
jgi:hypothetical protein